MVTHTGTCAHSSFYKVGYVLKTTELPTDYNDSDKVTHSVREDVYKNH